MAPPCHSDHVLEQLCSQRQWGFLCDCLVSVGDTYFRAHKAVLAACSSFFRMMFTQTTTRGEQRVDLSQSSISAQSFDLILQFMYMGRINTNSLSFSELKAAMQQLQMYFVPDSVEDLVRIQCPGSGLMFGVRMFPTRSGLRPGLEPTLRPESSTGNSRPLSVEDVPVLVAPPGGSDPVEQPCDLRKSLRKNCDRLKDRPRFGRTFTCDDCGFVFSCEKLLIEHILTCTNRKSFSQNQDQNRDQIRVGHHAESESSKSSDSGEIRFKNEEDWTGSRPDPGFEPGLSVMVKTEPESRGFSEAEMEPEPRPDQSQDQDSAKRIKLEPDLEQGENPDPESRCELCGLELKDGDLSAHYLSDHMTHVCACGRCGQVLLKGRQLQEHAQRCAESEENLQDHGENLQATTEATDHGEDLQNQGENHQEHEENPEEDSEDDDQEDICHLLDNNAGVSLAGLPPAAIPLDEPKRRHFCGICGRGFFQRCHLREHYTVHTKHKQFTCLTCGKGFLRHRQLRLHQDMHRGVARYVCPVCDQGTFLKHDHVRHMISHLSPGETICQVCFQMFPGAEQLERHLEVHLYVCSVCGEKFRLRKDMRTHYNSTHQSGRRNERV